MREIEKKFKHPEPCYRSVPFWAWNDILDDRDLKHQIDEMKKGGMTAGFIHSRIGLITPYLSREWLQRVRNAVKYAKESGVPIYLYDEDRWPSGFAGGLLAGKKKHPMKLLRIRKLMANQGYKSSRWTFKILSLPPHWWYNNSGYLDTLNQKAVGEFIKSTHVVYKNTVGKEFNKTIPAIFTDEPNYLSTLWSLPWGKDFYLPWTDGLDKLFQKEYNYDLRRNFLSLVENRGDYQKVRYHFAKLVSELFTKNFTKQIYDWCKENNIAFTGHYLMEDTLTLQVKVSGGVMPLYEYMHIPGIDHLGRQTQYFYLTIKQCSSVAHQLGKRRVLSELFGGGGQDFTFADRKWIGNYDTVLGVNLFCSHLWLYSMAGYRKRDWPPTISYQQPYWKYNKVIEDYFSRINFITNQGRFHADILVIHPIDSARCLYNPVNAGPVDRSNGKFISMLKRLSSQHYDYDLGDESLISKYGSIIGSSHADKKSRCQARFKVGKMSYKVVIIPPVISLRETTVRLLNSFIKQGGKVIGFSPSPKRIDGQKDDGGLLKQLYYRITVLENRGDSYNDAMISSISVFLTRTISITDVNNFEIEDIYYQYRIVNDDTHIYFMVNNNKEKGYMAKIKTPDGEKTIWEVWEPLTGNIYKVRQKGCPLYFPPAGSLILVIKSSKSYHPSFPVENLTSSKIMQSREIIRIPVTKWVCRQKGLNSLVIDKCQYRAEGMKRWSKLTYVLDVQNILETGIRNKHPFSIRYFFKTRFKKRPGIVFLIIERPEQYEIKVNEKKVCYRDIGYWIDIAFKKIDITGYLALNGKNTIEIKGRFVQPTKPKTCIYIKGGTEIESVYLTGSFNLEGKFRGNKKGLTGQEFIVVDSNAPCASDVVTSGYPFYAGEFLFSKEFDLSLNVPKGKRVFLSMDKLNAVTLKVSLNKREAGVILWQPYCLDITDFLVKGKNLIEIEITNTLCNLLGPHHQIRESFNPGNMGPLVGPGSFNDKNNWIDSYTFVPFCLSELILNLV